MRTRRATVDLIWNGQVHVEMAVRLFRLLYGLNLNGAALRVIGQGHPGPARTATKRT